MSQSFAVSYSLLWCLFGLCTCCLLHAMKVTRDYPAPRPVIKDCRIKAGDKLADTPLRRSPTLELMATKELAGRAVVFARPWDAKFDNHLLRACAAFKDRSSSKHATFVCVGQAQACLEPSNRLMCQTSGMQISFAIDEQGLFTNFCHVKATPLALIIGEDGKVQNVGYSSMQLDRTERSTNA